MQHIDFSEENPFQTLKCKLNCKFAPVCYLVGCMVCVILVNQSDKSILNLKTAGPLTK